MTGPLNFPEGFPRPAPTPQRRNEHPGMRPAQNQEPSGFPVIQTPYSPSAYSPSAYSNLSSGLSDQDQSDLSFCNHPNYLKLSNRHAISVWRRAIGWFTRVFRSDDVASRVAQASIGAQRPVTTGRRIVVVGASGGVGVTSVAVGLARTLTAIRNAPIALVSAGASNDLVARLNVETIARPETDLPADNFADQLAKMTQSGQLSAIRPRRDVAAMARGLGRFFPVTIVDAGQQLHTQLINESHAVVVVSSATSSGAVAAERYAAELANTRVNPAAVFVVLVPRSSADKPAQHVKYLKENGLASLAIPNDRHISGGAELKLRICSEDTQVILGELAAITMNPTANHYPVAANPSSNPHQSSNSPEQPRFIR